MAACARAILFLTLATITAHALESRVFKCRVAGFGDNDARILGLFNRCESQIKRYLPRSAKHAPEFVSILAEGKTFRGKGSVVFIPPDRSRWQVVPLLMRAALHRYVPREIEPVPTAEQLPDWLVAALTREVLLDRDIAPNRQLAIVRALKTRPVVDVLIEQRAPVADPILYQSYAQIAQVFWLAALDHDRQVLEKLLANVGMLDGPVAIAARSLDMPRDSIQSWLNLKLDDVLYDIFRPRDYAWVAEMRKAALALPAVGSQQDSAVDLKDLSLLQAMQTMKRLKISNADIHSQRSELVALLSRSPWLLREPINQDLAAMQTLLDGRSRRFQRHAQAAEDAFAAAYERALAVRDWLKTCEGWDSHLRLANFYHSYPPEALESEFEQAVSGFLDEVEAARE